MLSDFKGADKVYIACGFTDLRRGIDGLAGIVKQQFSLDPFSNTLFLFCGRKRDRLKALYWEGNGFLLLYKRLEQGVYQWPRNEQEARELTPQQYRSGPAEGAPGRDGYCFGLSAWLICRTFCWKKHSLFPCFPESWK